MAFLLSPKTDAGGTYALVANFNISVNGAPPQTYPSDAPGTVHPGDTIEVGALESAIFNYYNADVTIKTVEAALPYTVEAVAGAERMDIQRVS